VNIFVNLTNPHEPISRSYNSIGKYNHVLAIASKSKVELPVTENLECLRQLFVTSAHSFGNAMHLKKLMFRGQTFTHVITAPTLQDIPNFTVPKVVHTRSLYCQLYELSSLSVNPYVYITHPTTFLRLSNFHRMMPYIISNEHAIWKENLVSPEKMDQFIWAKWLLMQSIEPMEWE
jgi:hypothetical protein